MVPSSLQHVTVNHSLRQALDPKDTRAYREDYTRNRTDRSLATGARLSQTIIKRQNIWKQDRWLHRPERAKVKNYEVGTVPSGSMTIAALATAAHTLQENNRGSWWRHMRRAILIAGFLATGVLAQNSFTWQVLRMRWETVFSFVEGRKGSMVRGISSMAPQDFDWICTKPVRCPRARQSRTARRGCDRTVRN